MEPLNRDEYETFKKKYTKSTGEEMMQEIAELPEEIELFVSEIQTLPPKEQVQKIEQFVRAISHYDMKNREMMDLKRGKTISERIAIMEARVDELRGKEPENTSFVGKKFAGVCADFAALSAAILRKAGFVSGVATGFLAQGKSVTAKDAHGVAFVVWPDAKGKPHAFAVDGTPDGVSGISGPSLVDKEKIREEKIEEFTKQAEEKLEEVMKILESHDVESIQKLTNGELEQILNAVLRYEAKPEHLRAVRGMLNAYWYSGIEKADPATKAGRQELADVLGSEIERERKEKGKGEKITDPGGELFNTIEVFADKFRKADEKETSYQKMDLLLDVLKESLLPTERKAIAAIVTYLKAKKMKA